MANHQPTPGHRTQALIDEGWDLQSIICFTASDYKHACDDAKFAETYGGVSKFQEELFALIEKWTQREQVSPKNQSISKAFRRIGLALHATNGVIATDLPDLQPDETSWRVDHPEEILALEYLEARFNSTAANDFWKDRLKPRGFGCVCAKRSSILEE